jgi:HEAT repeat protein
MTDMSHSESSRPSESSPIAEDLVPRLVGMLDDADPEVRLRACVELREIGPAARDAVPRVVGLLADGARGVRLQAVNALADLGRHFPELVVPRLLGLVADGDTGPPRGT